MLSAARLLARDPAFFAEKILGIHPYPYQTRVLRDFSERLIVCGGRQIGKTTIAAIKAIHFASTGSGRLVLIISATMRQSLIAFRRVRELAENTVLRDDLAKVTRNCIELSNGSRVMALPSGRFGHGIRGYSADLVILDEAAFIPEEVIAQAVLPMLSATGGVCWMLSTPWDRRHIFYRAFHSAGWSRHHIPSTMNPLISKRFLEEQRRLIGEERFRAEYLAEFIDDRRSYFPMSLLRMRVEDYRARPVEGMYVGYDPGGRESLAAAVGLAQRAGKLYVMWWLAERTPSYSYFNSKLAEVHRRYGFARLLVDETGVGGPILEHLRALGLPASGIILTERSRMEVLTGLKLMLEQGRIALPDSPEVLSSLNCVEAEAERGRLRFTHRRGTHDDLAYALALAAWAARGLGELVVEPLEPL